MDSLASIDAESAEHAARAASGQLADAEAALQLSRHLRQSAHSLSARLSADSVPPSRSSNDSECAPRHSPGSAANAASVLHPNKTSLPSSMSLDESAGSNRLAAAWQAVYTAEWRAQVLRQRAETAGATLERDEAELGALSTQLGDPSHAWADDVAQGAAAARAAELQRNVAATRASVDADRAAAEEVAAEALAHVQEATAMAAAGAAEFGASSEDEEGDNEEGSDDEEQPETAIAGSEPDWEVRVEPAGVGG